jgi:hypothetical protein
MWRFGRFFYTNFPAVPGILLGSIGSIADRMVDGKSMCVLMVLTHFNR